MTLEPEFRVTAAGAKIEKLNEQLFMLEAELARVMKERDTANALLAEALVVLDLSETRDAVRRGAFLRDAEEAKLADLIKRMKAHLGVK